jgi:cold shock CspA family protein
MADELRGDSGRPEMDKSAKKGLVPGPSKGTVKSYAPGRNPFGGFILDERSGVDVFVHKTAVQAAGLDKIAPGEKLNFVVVEDGFGGFKAINLARAG